MARKIYSFMKIEKESTNKGIIASLIGIGSLLVLVILIIISVMLEGKLPALIGSIGYLSALTSAGGLYYAIRLNHDQELYGMFIFESLYINGLAVFAHSIIFLAGCIRMIV